MEIPTIVTATNFKWGLAINSLFKRMQIWFKYGSVLKMRSNRMIRECQ